MHARRAAALLLLGTIFVACDDPAAPAPGPTEAPAAEAPSVEEVPSWSPEELARIAALSEWLAGCAVSDAHFHHRKVFTWTTATQIAELRERPALLTRSRGAEGQPSAFDQSLEGDGSAIAAFLREPRHSARRFAWSVPWATRMGWEDGDYGDRLVAVTLRDDAWVARFAPDEPTRWQVFDADGQPVELATAERNPGRIGAVYHVGRGRDALGRWRAFREIVLVNEDQIERWSVGTADISERLARDAAQLRALAELWRARPTDGPTELEAMHDWLLERWPAAPEGRPGADALPDRYARCLALGSLEYRPDPAALEAIADATTDLPLEAPLEHTVPARRAPRAYGRAGSSTSQTRCDPSSGQCWTVRGGQRVLLPPSRPTSPRPGNPVVIW